jgi:hypothetical protein
MTSGVGSPYSFVYWPHGAYERIQYEDVCVSSDFEIGWKQALNAHRRKHMESLFLFQLRNQLGIQQRRFAGA